jgi:hypothetical protein
MSSFFVSPSAWSGEQRLKAFEGAVEALDAIEQAFLQKPCSRCHLPSSAGVLYDVPCVDGFARIFPSRGAGVGLVARRRLLPTLEREPPSSGELKGNGTRWTTSSVPPQLLPWISELVFLDLGRLCLQRPGRGPQGPAEEYRGIAIRPLK